MSECRSRGQIGSVGYFVWCGGGGGRENLLPNGDVDDDEEEQGEGGDPTADDERDGREQCLVHVLHSGRQEERHVECEKHALALS